MKGKFCKLGQIEKMANYIPREIFLLYCTILYYTIPYYTVLYYTVLYCTILYRTILYYTILYRTILYYTIPYYTVLYHTIQYYTVLYCTIAQGSSGVEQKVGAGCKASVLALPCSTHRMPVRLPDTSQRGPSVPSPVHRAASPVEAAGHSQPSP